MAKQEFLELARELSGRNLFDVDSVASFLEANFKAINLKNEMIVTDEQRQQLLLDKEKHFNEMQYLKRLAGKLKSAGDIGDYYQSIQYKLKGHAIKFDRINIQLQVLKSKRKGLNIEKSMESDRLMLEELKAYLRKEKGEEYIAFISEIRERIDKNLIK